MNFENIYEEDLAPMKKSVLGSIVSGVKNVFAPVKVDESFVTRQFATYNNNQNYVKHDISNSLYLVMDNYLRYQSQSKINVQKQEQSLMNLQKTIIQTNQVLRKQIQLLKKDYIQSQQDEILVKFPVIQKQETKPTPTEPLKEQSQQKNVAFDFASKLKGVDSKNTSKTETKSETKPSAFSFGKADAKPATEQKAFAFNFGKK